METTMIFGIGGGFLVGGGLGFYLGYRYTINKMMEMFFLSLSGGLSKKP